MSGQRKFIIRLNSLEKVEQLLQETYDLATNQINQIQNEISKIANSTPLVDTDIEVKEKYGKIMNNYLTSIQKAIDRKFEIAKFMGEVVKHNGDLNKTLNDENVIKNSTLDLRAIRESVKSINDSNNDSENYKLKDYKN